MRESEHKESEIAHELCQPDHVSADDEVPLRRWRHGPRWQRLDALIEIHLTAAGSSVTTQEPFFVSANA